MKKFVLMLLLIGPCLVAVSCGGADQTSQQSQPATSGSPASTPAADQFVATRAIYKEHCSKCHGDTGGGGRVQIEGHELRVPSLTGEHAKKPSDEKLAGKISNGDDDMPAFKEKLTAEQINDLVRFIRKELQQQ